MIAVLLAKTVDGASAFAYPLIFLPLISSAFVPTETMSGPVRLVSGAARRGPSAGSGRVPPSGVLAARGRKVDEVFGHTGEEL
ncbi:hypothetical protein H4W26_000832 [Nesterenkonia halotolerans]|uniref:Uncharacterized protein n=1 Tax=Nesterenkonia halotolerans TaxID=225325 RepID=A0ABR9J5F0_9MICC|nr:hypothetical protein [Nesterenkonia halotolerans]